MTNIFDKISKTMGFEEDKKKKSITGDKPFSFLTPQEATSGETPHYISDVLNWLKEKGRSILPTSNLTIDKKETPSVSVPTATGPITTGMSGTPTKSIAEKELELILKGSPKISFLTSPTAPSTAPPTTSITTPPITRNISPLSKEEIERISKELQEAKEKALEIQRKLQEKQKEETKKKETEGEEKKEETEKSFPISSSSMGTTAGTTEEGYDFVKKKLDELEKKYGTQNALAIAQQLIDLHNKELAARKTEAETEYELGKQKAEEALEETKSRIERGYEQLGYKPGFAGSTLESLNRDLAYAQAQFEKANTLLEKAKQEALARAEATQAKEDWDRYNTLFNTQLKLADEHLKNIQAYNTAKNQLLSQLSLAESRAATAARTTQAALFDKLDELTSPYIGKGIDFDSLPEETRKTIEQTAEVAGIPVDTIKQAMKNRNIKGTAKIGDTLVFYDENGNIIKSIVGKSEPTTTDSMMLLNAYIRGDIDKLPTNKEGIAALNQLEAILEKYPILRVAFDYRTEIANQIESGAILTNPFIVNNTLDLGLVKYSVLKDLGLTPNDEIITQIENAFKDLEVYPYLRKVASSVKLSSGGTAPQIIDRPLIEVINEKEKAKEKEKEVSESESGKGWIQKLFGG